MGAIFSQDGDILEVKNKYTDLKPNKIITIPTSWFSTTDMQAQMMLLLSMIKGHN